MKIEVGVFTSFLLLLLIRLRFRLSKPARQRCNSTTAGLLTRLATELTRSFPLSLVLVPGEICCRGSTNFLVFPGREALAWQWTDCCFAAVSTKTSTEGPFNSLVDGMIENIGKEGDNSKTKL